VERNKFCRRVLRHSGSKSITVNRSPFRGIAMKIIAKFLGLVLFAAFGSAHASLIITVPLLTSNEAGPNSFADPTRGPPTTGPGLPTGPGLGGDPRPLSFGTATFTLNDAQTALSFMATVFNIDFTGSQTPGPNDDRPAAHIHAGPAAAATFPVVWGFYNTPFNDLNSPGA